MSRYPEYQSWPDPQPRRRSLPWWGWTLLGSGLFLVVSCIGIMSLLVYVGTVGPETKVYTGNRVPARFIEIMRDVGALEDGERIDLFYSDAFVNIRSGFYYVSDRGVVIYSDESAMPLYRVTFDQIVDVSLLRNLSFFIDSEVNLVLSDGTRLWFPVSSEANGDVRFRDAIEAQMTSTRVSEP